MTWFKVDDGAAFHRKVLAAGNEAFGAWARAGAWSSAPSNLTEGWIPPDVAKQIAPSRIWAKLRAVGLTEAPYDGRPGEQIHDFLDYNPSAAKVRAEREGWAERQRRARESRRDQDRDGPPSSRRDGAVTHDDSHGHVTPVPIPIPIHSQNTHTHRVRAPVDDQPGVDPGSPTSPLVVAIRSHRVLLEAAEGAALGADAAIARLAEAIEGRRMNKAIPVSWVEQAIADAARDLEAEASGVGTLTWQVVATKVSRFASKARPPRPGPERPPPSAPPSGNDSGGLTDAEVGEAQNLAESKPWCFCSGTVRSMINNGQRPSRKQLDALRAAVEQPSPRRGPPGGVQPQPADGPRYSGADF